LKPEPNSSDCRQARLTEVKRKAADWAAWSLEIFDNLE